jgi:hypothetical protein
MISAQMPCRLSRGKTATHFALARPSGADHASGARGLPRMTALAKSDIRVPEREVGFGPGPGALDFHRSLIVLCFEAPRRPS